MPKENKFDTRHMMWSSFCRNTGKPWNGSRKKEAEKVGLGQTGTNGNRAGRAVLPFGTAKLLSFQFISLQTKYKSNDHKH
ncbi:hypothetical protein YDYSY3_42280 [Paenibacillus chitinolyticus]|nr:hypothetical protein YDYSY3_42280 [Paenibacillus chitinolyticus]